MQSSNQIQAFNFNGDAIDVVCRGDGELFVGVRRVCESLGIDFHRQIKKIRVRQWATFDEFHVFVQDDTLRGGSGDMQGDRSRMISHFMLHIDSFPMWLATIDADKVSPTSQPKLIAYQKEAARVLADHFLGRRGEAPIFMTADEVEAISRKMAQHILDASPKPPPPPTFMLGTHKLRLTRQAHQPFYQFNCGDVFRLLGLQQRPRPLVKFKEAKDLLRNIDADGRRLDHMTLSPYEAALLIVSTHCDHRSTLLGLLGEARTASPSDKLAERVMRKLEVAVSINA